MDTARAVECDAPTRVASQLHDQVLALEHLDTLLAHAPLGVAFFDLDLRFLRINEQLAEINGYSVAAHLGKTVEEILPSLATSLREVAARILATDQPVLNQELIGKTAGLPGIVRHWHASWYPVRDERGGITGFSSMVVDITEKKQAEDALQHSEQRFRGIFDSAFQFIGLMTPDGTLLEANRTALEAGGLRAENVIGKPFWECDWWTLTEQTGQELRTAIGRAASGELVRYDVNVRGAEGQVITIDLSIKPIRDETGRVVLLIPEGRDITDLKRAVNALRARTAELEILLDTLPGFVWISWDAECREIVGNRTANELILVDRGANVSQSVVATGAAPYLRQLKEDGTEYRVDELPLQRAVVTGLPVRDAVLDFHFSDGRRVQLVGDAVPLFDDQGRIRGGLSVFVDITERYQIELNLIAATANAERANRAKSEFLSNMSHELRTPLNAILGFAQLLESGAPAPTPSQKRNLEHIIKGGWYLLDLVNELLDLSQIESGKLSLKQEAVSLASVLLECQDMIETQARERGISVIFPSEDIPGHVSADHTRLKQVLINLLSNAVKYNKAHGAVTVEFALSPPDVVRVSVRDTGEGLAPEQLAQLFQPFNRLGREAGPEQGTGIGLVVSRHIVESMGGVIGVESVVGVGSVFWFELKWASAERAAC